MVELIDRVLQLLVKHTPVGDDDDAAVHLLVFGVVQRGEPMCQPADGVGLAGARRVLHKVGVPDTFLQRRVQQRAHRVPLVIAREQQRRGVGLFALAVLLLRDLYRQELADNRQPRIALQNLVPQVAGGITQFVVGRIAGTCSALAVWRAPIEWQEPCRRARQLGCHPHFVSAGCEMHHGPFAK